MERRLRRLPDWVYFSGLLPAFAHLPAGLAYRLARWQGRQLYRHRPAALDVMAGNLEQALKPLPPSERERIIATFCQVLTSEDLDAFFYNRWTPASLPRYFEVLGTEYLDEALQAGRGAILVTAHLGSPGSALAALGVLGYPVTHVGRSYEDPGRLPVAYRKYALEKMRWLEAKIGRPVIYAKGGPKDALSTSLQILRALKRNTLVSMAMDVPPQGTGRSARVKFFGRPSQFPTNFVEIALSAGVPLIPFFTVRCPRPRWHRHRVSVLQPVAPTSVGSGLQHCVALLEKSIQRTPEQWFAWDSLTHFWGP